MAFRPDIAYLYHRFGTNLLLDVQVEVLHVRSLDLAIEGEDIALETEAIRCRIHRRAHGETIARVNCGNNLELGGPYRVVGGARREERWIRKVTEHHILRESVIEHSEARAHHGPTLSCDIPRCADPRSKVLFVWVVEFAQPRLSDLSQCERPDAS